MADICPVCTRSISFITKETRQGINLHYACIGVFDLNPEKYGGKAIKKTETQTKAESEHRERLQKEIEKREELQQKIEDKSVYVKGFRMPFGEMAAFIFKWTMASIPTAIFLVILFLIFTAFFT